MDTKISIIVPIYNLEHYLPKCVDSILTQTFTDFELILVDDGSTDGSGELCDEYARLDKRVRVIHKKNGGIASSRNAGLDAAKGIYIGFVDNDDFINKFMFEILYKNAKKYSSDIVICDYISIDESQHYDIDKFDGNYKLKQFNNREAVHHIYADMDKDTFIYPWNKLYKKELFNDIKYELGNIYDDETVAHKLLYKSKRVTYVQIPLYYYVQRKGSQINSPFSVKKFGRVYALKERQDFFKRKNEVELQQKALKHYMDVFFWNYYLAKSSLQGIDKELKDLKQTFDQSLVDLLKHKNISWKQKVMFVLFSIHPSLYEFIKDTSSKRVRR
jgi:glycosyltransferase involved in cell wall biosynthesis